MNKDLIFIFICLRIWGNSEGACKGLLLKLTKLNLCNYGCDSCPIVQVRDERLHIDQIIQTFSQLNK